MIDSYRAAMEVDELTETATSIPKTETWYKTIPSINTRRFQELIRHILRPTVATKGRPNLF